MNHSSMSYPARQVSYSESKTTDAGQNEGGRKPAEPPADESALDRFEKALRQDDKQGVMDGAPMLPQFMSGWSAHGVSETAAPVKAAPAGELTELISRLVDKMWVKRTDGGQMGEVRLDLNSLRIPDTELKIMKSDGLLTVQFATASAASYQHLLSTKSQLAAELQRRYGQGGVSVDVSVLADGKGGDGPESEALPGSEDGPRLARLRD